MDGLLLKLYVGVVFSRFPNQPLMKAIIHTIFLLLGILGPVGLSGQSLQVGGQLGGTTLLMPAEGALQQAGSEGNVFMTYQRPRWQAGIQLGFRYTRWKDSVRNYRQNTIPLQARVALDQQKMIHVFAGPYIGFGRDTLVATPKKIKPKFRWGLTTGLDVRIPLSRRMVLVSAAQLDQSLARKAGPHHDPNQVVLAPKRMLVFSLHLGLAYWFKSKK